MQNRNFKILLSVAIFGLFGYLFYRIFDVERKVYKSTDSDVKLAAGSVMGSNASNLKNLDKINSEILEEDRANSNIIEKDPIDLTDPLANESSKKINLNNVSDGNAIGVVLYVSEESSGMQLKLTSTLETPAEGNTFEAWLYSTSNEAYVHIGSLAKDSAGKWDLSFSDEKSYVEFDKILVSSESAVSDSPETVILEGNL